jgi:hypothetical protein
MYIAQVLLMKKSGLRGLSTPRDWASHFHGSDESRWFQKRNDHELKHTSRSGTRG